MDVLSQADVFYYPQFTSGQVFGRGGSVATARLNYNRLVDEIHFISPKGDTLALDNEKDIKYIAVASDTFYYDGGYVRLLSTGAQVKLALRQVWVIADSKQVGAFNTTNNAVGITSYSSYNEGGRLYDLVVNEDVVLKKVEQYFLGDPYNHFVAANKKNLLSLFTKEPRRTEAYLRENKIDFAKRKDLDKVVQFLEAQ